MSRPSATGERRLAAGVVATCFTLGLIGRGMAENFPVFLLPLTEAFTADRASVVSIYATTLLAMGLGSPLAGVLFDRFGPRRLYGVGLGGLGMVLVLASFANALWQLHLLIGLGVGLATAALGNVPHSALLSRWFRGGLGAATGVVFSAFGGGIMVMVPLAQVLIDGFGWRRAYLGLGAVALAALVPLLLLPWRRIAAGTVLAVEPRSDAGPERIPSWTIARALRRPVFWGLFSVYFFTATGIFAVAAQAVAYLVEAGLPPLQAAAAWGITGVLMPVGMIGFGWLDDYIGRRPSVALSYAMTLVSFVVLWLIADYPSIVLVGLFIALLGCTMGSRGPLVSTVAVRIFRGSELGTILGSLSLGGGLGGAAGSWIGGVLHDLSGGYQVVIGFAFVSVCLGSLPFWTLKELRQG